MQKYSNAQTREDSRLICFFSIFARSRKFNVIVTFILALWILSIDRIARDIRLIRRSMTGIEIATAKDRLDQGLPVELAALGLHRGYQSLISLPGGDRCHFLFRSVLDLFVCIAAGVNRSLGSLTHCFCIRYHLQSPRTNDCFVEIFRKITCALFYNFKSPRKVVGFFHKFFK